MENIKRKEGDEVPFPENKPTRRFQMKETPKDKKFYQKDIKSGNKLRIICLSG